MNAFGSAEPTWTELVDDEYDVLNDETFGGAVPNDEWESDQVGEEGTGDDGSQEEANLLDLAASKLPISDDPLDFLERSISNLVADDDDILVSRKQSKSTKPLSNIFSSGSPQTPFFQLDKANIWSDPLVPSKKAAPTYELAGIMEKMSINGNNAPLVSEPGPLLVKGAKTAEELEAEMLGKSIPVAISTSPRVNAVGPEMKSCQELERELLESSRAAPKPTAVPAVTGSLPNLPALSQASAMAVHPPPPHIMLANPQVRAALIARWLAANPGAVPPLWLRMPPPPVGPPPPGTGFRPTIIRPRPNMPPVQFPNARMPHGHAAGGVGVMFQQGGAVRSSVNFPKRRLFDSPGRCGSGHDDRYDGRRREYNRGDPFAGLMTRRERSWLIKIQAMQLHSGNPYVDDYYWLMYRRRKLEGNSNAPVSTDAEHNDNIEHRVYVPPSFEGSLGKVQVLSAKFPRQLLDLAASSSNGETKQKTGDDDSPRDSPPVDRKQSHTTGGRRLKNILMELENMYTMLLEARDLAMMRETESNGDAKETAAARVKHLIQSIVSTLASDNRIVSALSIRKGRRLLLQLMPFCDKDYRLTLAESVVRNLQYISRKEPSREILDAVKLIFDSKLIGLAAEEWSQLWQATKTDAIETAMKSKLGCSLLLDMIQRSALDNAVLDEGAANIVARWAGLMFTTITGTDVGSQNVFSLDRHRVDLVCSWLKKLQSNPIPDSVVDAIGAKLTGETNS